MLCSRVSPHFAILLILIFLGTVEDNVYVDGAFKGSLPLCGADPCYRHSAGQAHSQKRDVLGDRSTFLR